jgi:hypothetical protein
MLRNEDENHCKQRITRTNSQLLRAKFPPKKPKKNEDMIRFFKSILRKLNVTIVVSHFNSIELHQIIRR